MLVKEMLDIIDEIAPFDTAESFDNVGLITGNPDAEVTGVMLALDVTASVVDEMVELGANLLITHHPLLLSPVRHVLENHYESRLILKMARAGVSMITAHTNLDKSPEGTNTALCRLLRLRNVTGEGLVRTGDLTAGPVRAGALQAQIARILRAPVILYGAEEHMVHRLGLCSGSGSDGWAEAFGQGADAFLTGEVKHHHALEAAENGMVLFAAGHFATEDPGMDSLCDSLQKALNRVECNVAVYRTGTIPYPVL